MKFFRRSVFPSIDPIPFWSIKIDISERELIMLSEGNPGATSQNRQFTVIGDIWLSNRRELLDELQLGEISDSAIIANLWERFGSNAVLKLQGMFAFAIQDKNRRENFLVRDRVGARTIYFALTNDSILIAPRLQTLAGRLSGRIDLIALRDFLCCAFVPGERTMWEGITEVRPGTILTLPDRRSRAYWSVTEQITDPEKPLEWHAGKLRARLNQVITEYLPPSEPVGCYLSGGLDSSLVVALAKNLHSTAVHTYSIHFGAETPNELEFSSLVAAHCRTTHHIIEIAPQQMWDLHGEAMALLDDPIGDPLTVPNLILGREAKKSVPVILNGEGGDPCFGGPKNQPMLLTNLYQSADPTTAMNLINAYLASFQKCATDLPRLLKPEIWEKVKEVPSVFAPALFGTGSYLNRLMFINTQFKGADHILTKVNNLTRACGLEGRSPLFDQRIVDLSLTIPPEYKLSGAIEKAVLKAAVSDLLPEAILMRPKSGMMVPVQYWFRKLWSKSARALLLNKQARIREFFNPEVIRDWLDYRGDAWSRYGVKLWLLASLELWLQTHSKPRIGTIA